MDGSRHVPGGEWAGGLASLANCHKKIAFPIQNNELPGKIRESLEKKERNTVIFFIRIQIYHITIRIIKLHRYTGVHSKNLNAHKLECFSAHGRKLCAQKLCVDEICLQLYHIRT